MLFLLSGFGEWWLSPELPAHCIHSSCVHNVQSLLGVIFDLVGIIFFLTDCSNFLLLFTQGMGKFPSASIVYCLYSSCVHNTPSLLGVNLRFNFCFLPSSLARFIFPFLMFGVQGVETSCKLSIGAFNFLKL